MIIVTRTVEEIIEVVVFITLGGDISENKRRTQVALAQLNVFKNCYLISIIQFNINRLLAHSAMVSSIVND